MEFNDWKVSLENDPFRLSVCDNLEVSNFLRKEHDLKIDKDYWMIISNKPDILSYSGTLEKVKIIERDSSYITIWSYNGEYKYKIKNEPEDKFISIGNGLYISFFEDFSSLEIKSLIKNDKKAIFGEGPLHG